MLTRDGHVVTEAQGFKVGGRVESWITSVDRWLGWGLLTECDASDLSSTQTAVATAAMMTCVTRFGPLV